MWDNEIRQNQNRFFIRSNYFLGSTKTILTKPWFNGTYYILDLLTDI